MTQQIRQICLHEESINHSFRTATKLIPLPLYASQQTFGQQVTFSMNKSYIKSLYTHCIHKPGVNPTKL